MNNEFRVMFTIFVLLTAVHMAFGSDNITVQTEDYTNEIEIHPNMYLNITEIEHIKEEVRLDQEPWNVLYDDMIKQDIKYLNTKPVSVITGGKVPPSGDLHDYYTEDVYISDGVSNTSADREDYYTILNVSRAVRSMGILYAFTGNATYANHAIKLINTWAVDPPTRMNPNYTNRQSKADLVITLPAMFYGADLIYNYPGWNQSDKETFKQWTRDLIKNTIIWSSSNNFENWRLVLISSGSVVADDINSRQYAFNKWKEIIPSQMNINGSLKYELSRKDSLTYSTFALNGMIQTAEIAQHNNVDLYNYELPDGRGLERSLDFHAPYIANPSKWNFSQNTTYKGDNAAIYELAYAFKQKPSYWQVIEKWKRPMYESKVLASITLTHGINVTRLVMMTIISPNGGESLIKGATYNLLWMHGSGVGSYVKVELLKNGTISSVISPITQNNGSFNWTIPYTQMSGNNYKIRVISVNNSTYDDTSNNSFIISAPTNILKNPGFEVVNGSLPQYWEKIQTGAMGKFTYPEQGRVGGKSIAVRYIAKEIGKGSRWQQSNITLVRYGTYKLSGYMKLENITGGGTLPILNGASLRVNWYTSAGGLIRTDLITKSGTIGWTKYEKIFAMPFNAIKASVGGYLYNASGNVTFDDMSFARVS